MQRVPALIVLLSVGAGWWWFLSAGPRWATASTGVIPITALSWNEFFTKHVLPTLPVAEQFDFPVRPPDAAGVWVARPFGSDGHLGEDWNTAVGNGDLFEPVYSPADGWVSLALDFQAVWGKVVMIIYPVRESGGVTAVEMMFAHLASMEVQPMTRVKRGQLIGRMGSAQDLFLAHLHWEVREVLGLGLGGGYSDRVQGWISPTLFLEQHRGQVNATSRMHGLPSKEWDRWGTD